MTPVALSIIIIYINTCYGSDVKSNSQGNETSNCAGKKCILKCCPIDEHVEQYDKFNATCTAYKNNVTLELIDLPVYNDEKNKVSTVNKSMTLAPSSLDDIVNINIFKNSHWFIIENGLLYKENPNFYDRWEEIGVENYCVDHTVAYNNNIQTTGIWLRDNSEGGPEQYYTSSAKLVTCIFLLLVFIVYALLPELRNLCGMILMAYVFSLFWAFLLLATIEIHQCSEYDCLGLTFAAYFFLIASFCWMNVMSYDIWWIFRGLAKARVHRREENFKFSMYCLYAFGVALLMTTGLMVMNFTDLRQFPWIVTPNIGKNGCFITGGEAILYLQIPILILTISNWIFYLMTAFNIWRFGRGTGVLDTSGAGKPATHRTHWHRFKVYLKLSVVMGLSWVFEVLSFLSPGFCWWVITDTYNHLIGIAIFIIFVCKKKIFQSLRKRFCPNVTFGAQNRPNTSNDTATTST